MPASNPDGIGITRENLAQRTLVALNRGGWDSPDVLLVDTDRGIAVVKDFAPRHPWVAKSLGRWLIRREARILSALRGHPAVPQLLGSVDPLALVIEHRAGARFSRRRPWTFGPAFAEQLLEAVAGLHERGVAHLDLRHRSNIRAGMDGRPVLIDFDSAVAFERGGWGERWLLPLLARFDLRGAGKWTRRIADSMVADADSAAEPRSDRARREGEWRQVSDRGAAGRPTSSVGSRGASRPTK